MIDHTQTDALYAELAMTFDHLQVIAERLADHYRPDSLPHFELVHLASATAKTRDYWKAAEAGYRECLS